MKRKAILTRIDVIEIAPCQECGAIRGAYCANDSGSSHVSHQVRINLAHLMANGFARAKEVLPRRRAALVREAGPIQGPLFVEPARVAPTAAEIEAGRSPAGGWTRKTLAQWGVPWPPPKGWRKALIRASGERTGQPADEDFEVIE